MPVQSPFPPYSRCDGLHLCTKGTYREWDSHPLPLSLALAFSLSSSLFLLANATQIPVQLGWSSLLLSEEVEQMCSICTACALGKWAACSSDAGADAAAADADDGSGGGVDGGVEGVAASATASSTHLPFPTLNALKCAHLNVKIWSSCSCALIQQSAGCRLPAAVCRLPASSCQLPVCHTSGSGQRQVKLPQLFELL